MPHSARSNRCVFSPPSPYLSCCNPPALTRPALGIDTPGAELSPRAEESAMAGEIAPCIAELAAMTVQRISVILGQGCGGGALALLAARTVIATENAWLAPLPPEGASVIVHADTLHAVE